MTKSINEAADNFSIIFILGAIALVEVGVSFPPYIIASRLDYVEVPAK